MAALSVGLLLTAVAGEAAAETWTLLWNEDFSDVSDWTLESHFTAPSGKLEMRQGALESATWRGPNYRTAADSTWDSLHSPILNISMENLVFVDYSLGAQNQQWSFSLSDTGSTHVPDVDDGADWMEVRFQDADCCAAVDWLVIIKDDGATTTQTSPQITQPRGKEIDANITINTNAKRFWINWSIGVPSPSSGSFTNTWSGDGPFAESTTTQLSLWGYTSTGVGGGGGTVPMIQFDNLALYTNQTGAPVPPPPPLPPVPQGQARANFEWTTSALGTQFRDLSTAPGNITSWQWQFADGYGSRRSNPFHPFPCAGNYFVTLEVKDIYGNSNITSNVVHIDGSSSFCGTLQRSESGVAVHTSGNQWFLIPEPVFIFLAVASAATLILGIDPEFRGQVILSRRLRLGLLVVSVTFLLLNNGAFSGLLG